MIILPHGGYPLIVCTLATMAWMTIMSNDGCDFAHLEGEKAIENVTGGINFENAEFLQLGFSCYRIPDDGDKISYSEGTEYNGTGFWWGSASFFQKIGLAFGGAACLFLWVSTICSPITRFEWRLIGIMLIATSIAHLLTYFWFLNDLCSIKDCEDCHCKWSYGSWSLMAAVFLYAVAIVCIFVKYPEPTVVKIVRNRVEATLQNVTATSEFDELKFAPGNASSRNQVNFRSSYSNRPQNQNVVV
jgi:hypothetical protein